MSDANESVESLYRELAVNRALQSMTRQLRLPEDWQLRIAARTLERAAGALAIITAAYTPAGTDIADRWERQIEELISIAASLRQTADLTTPKKS